ncbi:MAG: ImmA/IrrE family metallo-endopeptidase [Bacteroidota bacterium]
MSIEIVAEKSRFNPDKIRKWEEGIGDELPTIKQVEKLAKLYRRPLAVFYLPDIPRDFDTLKDFRSKNKNQFSTALVFIIREIQEKQSWMHEILIEDGESPLDFVGKFDLDTSPEIVADDIREKLGIITVEAQHDPLKYWINKSENERIFISRSSNYHSRMKIDVEEFKGFVIADIVAPFIFINSADYKNSQLFTLAHELAHIWINATGVSSDIEIDFRNRTDYDPIEIFCNEVAGNLLLPRKELHNFLVNSDRITLHSIEQISSFFGVSYIAALIRCLKLNLISDSEFQTLREKIDQGFFNYINQDVDKTKKGFPNPYYQKLWRNGKTFSQIVFDFYKGGKITGLEASSLLNTKINLFTKYEQYVYK